MFRVSFLVEDRKLPEILRNAAGKTYELEVVPVQIAPEEGAIKPPRESNHKDNRGRRPIEELELPNSPFRARDIQARLPTIGWSSRSITFALSKLTAAKRIRRLGGGKYEEI